MESETFRFTLLAICIPFAGYRIYKLYRKLFNFSKSSIKEKLENTYKN